MKWANEKIQDGSRTKNQCRGVAMPIIRSSNHLQDTQNSIPRQKSLYSNSGAKNHVLQWGGHLSQIV